MKPVIEIENEEFDKPYQNKSKAKYNLNIYRVETLRFISFNEYMWGNHSCKAKWWPNPLTDLDNKIILIDFNY